MRSRIQLRHVTEFKKYLEELIQLIEPVIGIMQIAVEKSKIWIEDKNDNPYITYIELCQELDSATTAMLGAALHIISENKETLDVDAATLSFYRATPQTTATEKCDRTVPTNQVTKQVQQTDDANVKSADDISEIKQWRDNFVTEQSDMWVNIEQLTKKQKQNFKNLRKQMSEQVNKVKELNKEIESLKEKETKSNKPLEKLSLDMKEYENNLNKINKEIQDHTDKTCSITQDIKRLSDLIVTLQDENNKILDKTSTRFEKLHSKHSVMYKLLQQRLMPIDKLIQIFNQNLETRKERINKLDQLENTISKLSKDFPLIESRVCNRYACHVRLAGHTSVSDGSMISKFKESPLHSSI
ncbi:uncharacterized protein LOC131947431 [Physella acuta]|uniref:uncharacterized protein LOC131947431 n=1 Tax=Physella acuta TaxID=109671 RepID=UPI0027DB3545|nr:uncharacterized protein LOC131947431 [Physella acuta]